MDFDFVLVAALLHASDALNAWQTADSRENRGLAGQPG
jgi:hypothetical protein